MSRKRSALEKKFIEIWSDLAGPPIEEEYKFHNSREWRFDFALPEMKVAFEIEGGVYIKGRHSRPKGYTDDCLKYNEATLNGWLVLRLPTDLVTRQYISYLISKVSGP